MNYLLSGADVKVFVAGELWKEVQDIEYNIDRVEEATYGIDSPYPQEVKCTKISVSGAMQVVVQKGATDIKAKAFQAAIQYSQYNPYVSLRIKDRSTDTDILWVPQIKISAERCKIGKGIIRMSYTFTGIIPYTTSELNG